VGKVVVKPRERLSTGLTFPVIPPEEVKLSPTFGQTFDLRRKSIEEPTELRTTEKALERTLDTTIFQRDAESSMMVVDKTESKPEQL
jgi:hypothetical protein